MITIDILRQKQNVKVTVRDASGVTVDKQTLRVASTKAHNDLARKFGLSLDDAARLRIVGDDLQDGGTESITFGARSYTVEVRGLLQSASQATAYEGATPQEAFADALRHDCVGVESIMSWRRDVAAVDFDGEFDERDVALIAPSPSYRWRTHGGGLRLIYFSSSDFTAREYAACAILRLRRRYPTTPIELKRDTRHPMAPRGDKYCGAVHSIAQSTDLSYLRSLFFERSYDSTMVEEWLAARGLQYGRNPHTLCPIAPDSELHADREPVVVLDEGIMCHRCAGHSITRGSKRPGYFPYAALLGDVLPSTISSMVQHFCHYDHARHYLAKCVALDDVLLREIYSALLKLLHGNDPRISAALTNGQDLIRCDRDTWFSPSNCRDWQTTAHFKDVLASLPATQCLDDKGEPRTVLRKLGRFEQNFDLSEDGYPGVKVVRGSPLWGLHLAYNDDAPILSVPPQELKRADLAARRPKYIKSSERLSFDVASARLQELLPKININYLLLLLVARGYAEGMPTCAAPMLAVYGASKSGKTQTVNVAAEILGDNNTEIVCSDTERAKQALGASCASGAYTTFNEILKDSVRTGKSARQAMEFILTLDPKLVYHRLYGGPTELGPLGVLVFTETLFPLEVRASVQIARRMIEVRLNERTEWNESLRAHGINGFRSIRATSDDWALVCDSILSHVADEYFLTPSDFESTARQLGFNTMENSAASLDERDKMRSFFNVVCAISDDEWIFIDRDKSSALGRIYESITLTAGYDWRNCTRFHELDWGWLVGSDVPIIFDNREVSASQVKVQFRAVVEDKTIFNKKILEKVRLSNSCGK